MGGTLIFSFGIRRGGNHVVRNWVDRQFEQPTHHIVNARLAALMAQQLRGERRLKDYNMLYVEFESQPLDGVNTIDRMDCFDKVFGKYDQVHKLFILRDPWNFFASRLKHREKLYHDPDHLWPEYAEAFVQAEIEGEYVLYNQFVTDVTTRGLLSDALGGEFDDSAIDDVSQCGGGSSFDGRDYHGKGRQMKVFSRWREYWEDPEFRALFTDEIVTLADAVFLVDDPEHLERRYG